MAKSTPAQLSTLAIDLTLPFQMQTCETASAFPPALHLPTPPPSSLELIAGARTSPGSRSPPNDADRRQVSSCDLECAGEIFF